MAIPFPSSTDSVRIIDPQPSAPKEQPAMDDSKGQRPVSDILLDMLPTLLATLQQLNAESESDVEKASRKIKALLQSNPDALPLLLAENSARQQRSISMLKSDPAKLVDPADPINQTARKLLEPYLADLKALGKDGYKDVSDTFTKILTEAKADTVDVDNKVLGNYAKFMTALSELMTKINSAVTAGKDGKQYLNPEKILQLMADFREKWDQFTITWCDSSDAAKEFIKRFRGDTIRVGRHGNNIEFNLRTLFAPIVDVITGTDANAQKLKDVLGGPWDTKTVMMLGKELLRGNEANSAIVQTLQLATNDSQKTYQTDLDLQINNFSRSNSQFDNLTKLYASMLATLTDSYKGFLNT